VNAPGECSIVEATIAFDEEDDKARSGDTPPPPGDCPPGTGPLCDSSSAPRSRESYAVRFQDGYVNEAWFDVHTRCEAAPQYARAIDQNDSIRLLLRMGGSGGGGHCDKRYRILWDPDGRGVLNSRGLASAQLGSEWLGQVTVTDESSGSPYSHEFRYTLDASSAWNGSASYGWHNSMGFSAGFGPVQGGIQSATGSQITAPVTTTGMAEADFIPVPAPGASWGGSLEGLATIEVLVQHRLMLAWVAQGHPAERRGSHAQGSVQEYRPGLAVLMEGGAGCEDRAMASWHPHSESCAILEHICAPRWPAALNCACD
jgi:hypothetical protein